MPKSIFHKLGIGEAKPATVMLQLADHSYVQPEGKIEDILVQVDKFIFPADFLILYCEANEHAPIIHGRSFLSTSRAVVDFDKDEIIFKVNEDSVKMKSLTMKLNKGKSFAESSAKDTPRTKLYMGAHVEMDRAAMTQNKWRSPKRKKRKSPMHLPNKGLHRAENISRQIFYKLGTAVKSAADIPARKQLAVKSASETRLRMASARYTMIAAKNRWEEQGFYFDDRQVNYGLEQFVYNHLNELGWFRLARQPARANYNWVIEFYANNSAGEDHSTVRGRRVPANTATINTILGLPDTEPSFYAMLGGFEAEDFELIKDYLCKEGTSWNTTGRNPHSVSRLTLRPEVKLWNTFVKRNIMPTSHNQTVDRTRLLLIHTIITGYKINVGEILTKELAAACANDKGILAFPCLISALCRRAAVPTSQGDKFQPEKTGWMRATYMRKMDVADATPLNVVMPTPPTSPIHTAAAPTEEAGPSAQPLKQNRIKHHQPQPP
ncbi:hypothetical protein GQ457_14G015960 [Hibiscus cannabinus]